MKAKFLKASGLTESQFYQRFPDESSFFHAYPHLSHMQMGGEQQAKWDAIIALTQQGVVDPNDIAEQLNAEGIYETSPDEVQGYLEQYAQSNEEIDVNEAEPDSDVDDMEEMKKGGNWIKGAIKHPGRCTPGSPNYDCPEGSPQWNLAQTFKKHKGFHKDGGAVMADGGIPPIGKMTPQQWQQYNTQQGLALSPYSGKAVYPEYYNPKQYNYTPSDSGGVWEALTSEANVSFGKPLSQHFSSYKSPTDTIIPSKAYAHATSNRTAVGFDAFGPGTVSYKDNTTGAITNLDAKGNPIGQMLAGGFKHGGQPCYNCGGDFPKHKDIAKFLKNYVKQDGGTAGANNPGDNTDDFLKNRKNVFTQYLAANNMNHMADQVAQELADPNHPVYTRQFGGGLPKAQYGNAGETEAQRAERERRTAAYMASQPESIEDTPSFPPTNQIPLTESVSGMFNDPMPSTNGLNWSTSSFQPPMPSGVAAGQAGSTSEWDAYFNANPIKQAMPTYSPQDDDAVQKANGSITAQTQPSWLSQHGQQLALGAIAGTNILASLFDQKNQRAQKKAFESKLTADNVFGSRQFGDASRGDYVTNSGAFRPDRMIPTQFRGNIAKHGGQLSYQIGGEIEMTDEEIQEYLRQGGTLEYID